MSYVSEQIENTIFNALDKAATELNMGATANTWLEQYKELSNDAKHVIIKHVCLNQTSYLREAFDSMADDIYIPFIGKFEPIAKRVVKKRLLTDNPDFDIESNKELIDEQISIERNEYSKRNINSIDVPVQVINNLKDILKKYKK